VHAFDRSSLRLLGTVGEPIAPDACRWYHDIVGEGRCPMVDTWWQTGTGGVMIMTLPGRGDAKPGAAGQPLPESCLG
jgi:acetyl-CoA synthetase